MWNTGTSGSDCWNTKEAKVAKMTGGPIFVSLASLVFKTELLTAEFAEDAETKRKRGPLRSPRPRRTWYSNHGGSRPNEAIASLP